MRLVTKRIRQAGLVAAISLVALALPGLASAKTTVFSYTGSEQTYTVPSGITQVYVTAIGARGGGPTTGFGTAGRGERASRVLGVTPGQTLYVEVGGIGGLPDAGWNGGGAGGTNNGAMTWGGGGASDVRTSPRSDGDSSLGTRKIVAGGGGGSVFPAFSGGNAGMDGSGCCAPGNPFPMPLPAVGGRAGTTGAGGHGGCRDGGTGCFTGCADPIVACGGNGALGVGGAGAGIGDGFASREGSGGGGGVYGGGGGAAVAGDWPGSGGGGSSNAPNGGVHVLANLADAPSVAISTSVPKYTALEIPVYLCFTGNSALPPAGTHIADAAYIDKGNGDRHFEMVDLVATPGGAAVTSFPVLVGGVQFATITVDPTSGLFAPIELSGNAVPGLPSDGNANVEVTIPSFNNFVIASSYCNVS
jgi:hypothetical protein